MTIDFEILFFTIFTLNILLILALSINGAATAAFRVNFAAGNRIGEIVTPVNRPLRTLEGLEIVLPDLRVKLTEAKYVVAAPRYSIMGNPKFSGLIRIRIADDDAHSAIITTVRRSWLFYLMYAPLSLLLIFMISSSGIMGVLLSPFLILIIGYAVYTAYVSKETALRLCRELVEILSNKLGVPV